MLPQNQIMGSLPDKKIAEFALGTLQSLYDIQAFVETGTYKGVTTAWASQYFQDVYTIDISHDYIAQAKEKLNDVNNITYLHGDTRNKLKEAASCITKNAIFWLDAHKGGGYFGDGDDCPIIEEILAIQNFKNEYCILIDDVRAFLFPPQPPFDYKKWPTISTILRTLDLKERRFNFIADDVLVSVPEINKELMITELHKLYPKFY